MSKEKMHSESNGTSPNLKTTLERLIQLDNLHLCLECGKCSAICPMLDFYGEYAYDRSPRGVVEHLILEPEKTDDEAFWYCLSCKQCTFFCPSGVNFQDFITDLREILLSHGYNQHAEFCLVCGAYLMPKKEFEYLIKDTEGKNVRELLSLCLKCKTDNYRATLYRMASWPKASKKTMNQP